MTPLSENLTPADMTLSVVSNITLRLGYPATFTEALQMFSPELVKKKGHSVSTSSALSGLAGITERFQAYILGSEKLELAFSGQNLA